MSDLTWPDRRRDVLAALDALARLTADDADAWPGLTDAIHWLVDDTWWDQHPPADDVGRLLRNPQEASSVQSVLDALLPILDDLGPDKPDPAYLTHHQWPRVRAAAQAARHALADHPGPGRNADA